MIKVVGEFQFETENGTKVWNYQFQEEVANSLNSDITSLIGASDTRKRNAFITFNRKLSDQEIKDLENKANQQGFHIYTLQTNFPIVSVGQRRYGITPEHNQVQDPETGQYLPLWRYSVLAKDPETAKAKLFSALPDIDWSKVIFTPHNRRFLSYASSVMPDVEPASLTDDGVIL